MNEVRTDLNIDEVEFDDQNPRIKGALEKYGDSINAERIHFALQSSSDEGAKNTSGFHRLKTSIGVNKGIMDPIRVVRKDGNLICIDGNTRLAIYRDFSKDDSNGIWQTIPAVVLEDATQVEIEKVRVTAHLVGARQWPAYEKAKYLKHLRYQRLMDYEEIIALCGGNKSDIEEQIDAFEDMNTYYKERVEDSDFKIDRFSGFVELQKRGIKEAIYEAGYDLSDFGDWLHKGNIYALADVRRLPKVLRDEEAKEKFANGGVNSIKSAIRIVDDKNRDPNENLLQLGVADVDALARALKDKLDNMTQLDLDKLKSDEEVQELLRALSERLAYTLDYAGK